MTGFKLKLIAFFLFSSFIFGCIFSVIKASNKIAEFRAEINQLQTQLQQCKNTNQQLINQVQLQQEEYEKAVKEIQEASIKPVKRVYIRQVIKKPVYITNEDCEKMADLINQAQEQLQK